MSRLVSILTIQFQPQKDLAAYELVLLSNTVYSNFTIPKIGSPVMLHSDIWAQTSEELRRHFTVIKVEHKMELSEEEKQEEDKARLRAKKNEVETIMKLQAVKGQAAGSWRDVPEAQLEMIQKQMERAYKRMLEEAFDKEAKAQRTEYDSKVWTGR